MLMRFFHVHAKNGHAATLLEKFRTVSADVVQHEPGNKGFFFGQGVSVDENVVVFASLWENLDAVKSRFGEDWQASFLPEGYEAYIEDCSVQHVDLGSGWFVDRDDQ